MSDRIEKEILIFWEFVKRSHNLSKMYRIFGLILIFGTVYSNEVPSSYTLLEKHAVFKSDLKTEPIVPHKEVNEHPVYTGEEFRNEGRARIEPVRPTGPVVKQDAILADQATSPTEINRVDNMGMITNGYIPSSAEVVYPDIPYAPGYGYDNGFTASNNYDLYDPYLTGPDTSTFGLLWSQVPDSRTLVSYVGRTISWIFNSIFVLLLGSILTFGVCTYTNICTIRVNGIGPIHEEMRALVSPEKLEKISHAADFVKKAIDKYQQIQKVTDGKIRKR